LHAELPALLGRFQPLLHADDELDGKADRQWQRRITPMMRAGAPFTTLLPIGILPTARQTIPRTNRPTSKRQQSTVAFLEYVGTSADYSRGFAGACKYSLTRLRLLGSGPSCV
jgi:hypothetical protein